ncbi:methyltransferase domain-containing protein [Methyloglobulus sp.]|uniref:class I SAM-dependent methyltransferase n=1 Tax=Methyloglobulus sp. TaxID=2518622 RepID=UPI0032B7CCCD
MKRSFLFGYYETPRGKLLRDLEVGYLQSAIVVSCKQTVLQIGGLGWESEFVDCTLYTNYTILDAKNLGCQGARKIRAKAYHLPLQCESVDMIILPHILEFDAYRFHTMREVERVLKPEGTVVILNFNPWSVWVRYQYIWDKRLADSWSGHFIRRSRVIDWLKLLNFEVTTVSQFNLDSIKTTHFKMANIFSLSAAAYGVKAIKRRYNLIPLTPVKNLNPRLALASTAMAGHPHKKHE